jgi:hypothetical protein
LAELRQKLADFVILSRDPTQSDPSTIDRIQVTETVKEGKTIYVLDAAEQRKADLMILPDAKGDNAFSNTLVAPAVHREPASAATGAQYDATCVTSVMGDLVAAMMAGTNGR